MELTNDVARIEVDDSGARSLCWQGRTAQLDATDVEILRVLGRQVDPNRTNCPPGFVRATAFAHLVPDQPHLAIATIRRLVRQLERKLAPLGDPPLLECCDRRGYRVRVRVAQSAMNIGDQERPRRYG